MTVVAKMPTVAAIIKFIFELFCVGSNEVGLNV
jgi:hypothetical protein